MVDRSASVRLSRDTFFGAGELDEVVDRRARVAHRGSGDASREKSERRKSVQRAVDHRPVEYREHPLVRNEHLVCDGVVTAGASQAERVPGVQDLQLLGGQRDHGRAILEQAAGEQHVGVGDAAAERPAAGHDDAAVHAACLALRRPHAGGHTASTAEQLVARLAGGR